MSFSLLHFLASYPRNADTLRRALSGDVRACRLLAVLGVTPLDLEAVARARTARRAAAWCAPQSAVDVPVDMGQIRDLLGVHDNAEVPAAIRALRNRAAFAEAASEHGPIADLLAMGCWRVSVQRVGDWYITQADRVGARPVGTTENATSPREAVLALRERVKTYLPTDLPQNTVGPTQHEDEKVMATLPARPSEPIVLGPWRKSTTGILYWFRRRVGDESHDLPESLVQCVGWRVGAKTGDEADEAGKATADKWARENGYVLLDAEPGSLFRVLTPWRDQGYSWVCGVAHDPEGVIIRVAKTSGGGWWVFPSTVGGSKAVAHGYQIGEEGKRYALAAAHALGLTGGAG